MRIFFIVLSLAGLAGCAVNENAEIDRLLAEYSVAGMPGAAVMVIQDGRPIATRCVGLADVAANIVITPETNFRLASVTKQFTATSILMLVDRGKLGLDDSIRGYFPEFPEFTDAITIRHMLQHTSGLEDYEPIYGNRFPEQVGDSGVVDIIAHTQGTYFEPGSEYRYSNSAYAILAVLIEILSGKSFAEFLNDNIFVPVGMTNTVAHRQGISTVSKRALGYTVTEGVVGPSDQSAWSAVLGDGGIYSSLTDLFKWDQALYRDDLISAELRMAAWTPGHEDYGFGWRIDEYKGSKRYHHSGSTSGFRNFMQQFPAKRLTIIVLTNRADPDVQPLAEKIADLYL